MLELSFVENYLNNLDAINHEKERCPCKLAPTYIHVLTALRILFSVPCRQPEGFTRSLNRSIPLYPPVTRSGLRKSSLA